MAKQKAGLVEDMVDDDPGPGGQAAVATADVPIRAKAIQAPDTFPWGWLVKHPGYGAMRIRRDQANSTDEALEVYRKAKCPHMTRERLDQTGLRLSSLAFKPADTERGK